MGRWTKAVGTLLCGLAGAVGVTAGAAAAERCDHNAAPAPGSAELSFEETTARLGPETLLGRYGHGGATGDADNDGRADLFLGTYAAYPPLMATPSWNDPEHDYKPDMLLLNRPGGFVRDTTFPEVLGFTSGQAFVDVDNDGDNDLIVSKFGEDRFNQETAGETLLMRNDGGRFRIVEGAIPRDADARVGGRSVGVLDYDGDGYLDLFIAQDRYSGSRSNLLRNPGTWNAPWEDVTDEAGLAGVEGFGVATQDLTGDGLDDLFVVGQDRVFVNRGDGTFRESGAQLPPRPPTDTPNDFYVGVTTADLNRDGRNDVLLGAHYISWEWTPGRPGPAPTRLLINRGLDAEGDPVFTEETAAAGLPVSVRSKSATVHVVDIDNDGFDDIVPGVARSADRPAIFRNTGRVDADGVPQFEVPENVGTTPGVDHPVEPQAWVAAPHADFDRDGRQDFLLDYFFDPAGVHLIRNTTQSGHWLAVSVDSRWNVGPGTLVEVFEAGGLGRAERLIGRRTITASEGYTSGVVADARFGLGRHDRVDVRATLPAGPDGQRRTVERLDVAVDRELRLPGRCPTPARDIAAEPAVDVTEIELRAPQPLVGGAAAPVDVRLVNRTGKPATAIVGLRGPDGWSATRTTVFLPTAAEATATVELTPPSGAPSVAPTVVADVTAVVRGRESASGWPSLFQLQSVPAPEERALALDAGTASSAVSGGFDRLAPEDLWAEDRAAGWVGAAPRALDRNAPGNPDRMHTDRPTDVDALRRDFVYDGAARTLRLRVPAGEHVLYALTGDEIVASTGMAVSVDGRPVARTGPTAGPRVSEWLAVPLDGGEAGRTIDVTFAKAGAEDWKLGALVLR
jgi:hypothetical protein